MTLYNDPISNQSALKWHLNTCVWIYKSVRKPASTPLIEFRPKPAWSNWLERACMCIVDNWTKFHSVRGMIGLRTQCRPLCEPQRRVHVTFHLSWRACRKRRAQQSLTNKWDLVKNGITLRVVLISVAGGLFVAFCTARTTCSWFRCGPVLQGEFRKLESKN